MDYNRQEWNNEESGYHKSTGQTVREHVPGTADYEARQGMTGPQSAVQQAKAYIPGTEEHRIRDMDRAAGGTGTGGYGVTSGAAGYDDTMGQARPTMGQRVKAAIPGTEEHAIRQGREPYGNTGVGGIAAGSGPYGTTGGVADNYDSPATGGGYGTTAGGPLGTGAGDTYGTAGSTDTYGTTGGNYPSPMTGVGGGVAPGTTSAGMLEGENKGLGTKIKELIPGTREREVKKMEQGRI